MGAGKNAGENEGDDGNATHCITSIVGVLTYAINGVAICAQP
jgi:hypothetical protein